MANTSYFPNGGGPVSLFPTQPFRDPALFTTNYASLVPDFVNSASNALKLGAAAQTVGGDIAATNAKNQLGTQQALADLGNLHDETDLKHQQIQAKLHLLPAETQTSLLEYAVRDIANKAKQQDTQAHINQVTQAQNLIDSTPDGATAEPPSLLPSPAPSQESLIPQVPVANGLPSFDAAIANGLPPASIIPQTAPTRLGDVGPAPRTAVSGQPPQSVLNSQATSSGNLITDLRRELGGIKPTPQQVIEKGLTEPEVQAKNNLLAAQANAANALAISRPITAQANADSRGKLADAATTRANAYAHAQEVKAQNEATDAKTLSGLIKEGTRLGALVVDQDAYDEYVARTGTDPGIGLFIDQAKTNAAIQAARLKEKGTGPDPFAGLYKEAGLDSAGNPITTTPSPPPAPAQAVAAPAQPTAPAGTIPKPAATPTTDLNSPAVDDWVKANKIRPPLPYYPRF